MTRKAARHTANSLNQPRQLTYIDLFCGIGGFHYAADALGLRCVFASDMDQHCRNQYRHNLGLLPAGDITAVDAGDIPDHDILMAGFPCQPFSIIGSMHGTRDARGQLFHEIIRIAKRKKPRALILENVKQLATIGGGRVLAEILRLMGDLGYATAWRVLNALDYGLPQKRERVIIVGLAGEAMQHYAWPKPARRRKPLAEVLEKNPAQHHYVSAAIRAKRLGCHTASERPAIWHENKGGHISSLPYSCALRANASYNYLLVDGERRLTPREQLRLQGFPDTFEVIVNNSQIRKQTGNAVPVPLARAVIREAVHALGED